MSDVARVCAECKGASGNPLAGRRCTAYACKEAHAAKLRARYEALQQGTLPAPAKKAKRTFCFAVTDVFGQVYCSLSDLTDRDRRTGRDCAQDEVLYLVRGEFGEDKRDTFFPDTRWVPLKELVDKIDEAIACFRPFARRDALALR